MTDEELRILRELEESEGESGELLEGMEQAGSLPTDIERRYMEFGRQLLADDVPRRVEEPQRRTLERYFGRDLKGVRLHVGERAQRAAEALGAQAFALGESDVFFGRGVYTPSKRESVGLLAHEIAHTLEAGAPGGRAIGFAGEPSASGQDEARAEQAEADVLGRQAGAGQDAGPGGPASGALHEPIYLRKLVVEREAWEKLVDTIRLQRERTGD